MVGSTTFCEPAMSVVVILDSTLEETQSPESPNYVGQDPKLVLARHYSRDLQTKLKLGYRDTVQFHKAFLPDDGAELQLGLLGMLSQAYSRHRKVAIAPHDIWFLLMTELAEVISENAEALRPIFTSGEGKTQIALAVSDPTDLTRNIDAFEAELRRLVPVDVSIFVPEFSTHTRESRVATMAAFMDGVKVYYDYMMFLCGIPAVKVLGTIQDWQMIMKSLVDIDILFTQHGVSVTQWFENVSGIILSIISTLAGNDRTEFWKNMFSQKNVGSGSQLSIDGWIVQLYRNRRPGIIDSFPQSWACVPFTNLHEPDVQYRSIHGAFVRQKDEDGFLTCQYADMTVVPIPAEVEEKNKLESPRLLGGKWVTT
jgi:hypothetical protein